MLTHLVGLAKLPVFADEAIYIRWAQLIIDDTGRYLFFPLNDGKTPLFIWQLVPALWLFQDPLYAARLVSVLGGLLQIGAIVWLIKELKGGRTAQVAGALFVALLPFWFFHHRMALMDGWLTLWLTLALCTMIRAIKMKNVWMSLLSGVFLGASLLTKVPAILAVPSLVLMSSALIDTKQRFYKAVFFEGTALLIGVGIFLGLKLTPAFSQIFSRGGDFLFTFDDIKQGIWLTTIHNIPSYIHDFWQYATPGVVLLFLAAFFLSKQRKIIILLTISFVAFTLPIALMGKVVYPRYLFPAMIFVTVQTALATEWFLQSKVKLIRGIVVGFLMLGFIFSFRFDAALALNPDTTPFVSADMTQYLTEWSSGHGIKEVDRFLIEQSQDKRIAVATEGYFGTLPDGLLMYLHNQDVSQISVEGAGVPITGIPQVLIKQKNSYDRFWLLVNSHRKNFDISSDHLLARYCRPHNAPCLELWDVTSLVQSYP